MKFFTMNGPTLCDKKCHSEHQTLLRFSGRVWERDYSLSRHSCAERGERRRGDLGLHWSPVTLDCDPYLADATEIDTQTVVIAVI